MKPIEVFAGILLIVSIVMGIGMTILAPV